MKLSRYGRKWYEIEVLTSPPVSDGWEATFDEGTSWKDAEVVLDPTPAPINPAAVVLRWLINGEDAPPVPPGADVDHTLTTDAVQPVIRAAADQEVEAFAGPLIIRE
jgi:hypothetical protein